MILLNSMGSMTFSTSIHRNQLDLPRDLDAALSMLSHYRNEGVLILEGGMDIDPAIYGQENRYSHCDDSTRPSSRDYRELALLRLANELGMWVWGNCRGHQLMCAATGGTLYQDLREYRGSHNGSHSVELYDVGSTIFAERGLPVGTKRVNSLHHQGTNRVPDGARVIATAHDGLVEGLYWPELRMASVQWHPEFMHDPAPIRWIEYQLANPIIISPGITLTTLDDFAELSYTDPVVTPDEETI